MAIVHTKSIASWEGSGDMRLRIINSAKIIWLLGFCISCGGVILVDHDYRLTEKRQHQVLAGKTESSKTIIVVDEDYSTTINTKPRSQIILALFMILRRMSPDPSQLAMLFVWTIAIHPRAKLQFIHRHLNKDGNLWSINHWYKAGPALGALMFFQPVM